MCSGIAGRSGILYQSAAHTLLKGVTASSPIQAVLDRSGSRFTPLLRCQNPMLLCTARRRSSAQVPGSKEDTIRRSTQDHIGEQILDKHQPF